MDYYARELTVFSKRCRWRMPPIRFANWVSPPNDRFGKPRSIAGLRLLVRCVSLPAGKTFLVEKTINPDQLPGHPPQSVVQRHLDICLNHELAEIYYLRLLWRLDGRKLSLCPSGPLAHLDNLYNGGHLLRSGNLLAYTEEGSPLKMIGWWNSEDIRL